tara:strand:- start:1169 stop:1444 length:276 start_codon:yes stop_codon:yes gene_type:complete
MNMQKLPVPQDKALKKAFGLLMDRLQAAIDRHNKRRDAIRDYLPGPTSLLDELRERADRVRHLNEVRDRLSELLAYYECPEGARNKDGDLI